MKISVSTKVSQSMLEVAKGFDEKLFTALSPPFPKVQLKRFDGSTKGDIISLELDFIFFKQLWTSEIIDNSVSENRFEFIDSGIELPFFLKYWRHQHVILEQAEGSTIVDNIEFKTPFIIFDYLMYPLMYLQFVYRRPIYKKLFGLIK
ncbi:MAG: ligand-binding SRPBCC domain-containing protein [Roseivirga sp.]|jgi:ligand-binding SRPBCC domain-containing protein